MIKNVFQYAVQYDKKVNATKKCEELYNKKE